MVIWQTCKSDGVVVGEGKIGRKLRHGEGRNKTRIVYQNR